MSLEINNQTEKASKEDYTVGRFMKIFWLIPILILGYIGWMNLLPMGSTQTFIIDVGGQDTSGNAKLTGPFDRISSSKDIGGISLRCLEKNLVYFEMGSRMLRDVSEVSTQVRFNDGFPEDGKFILGVKNKEEWSYNWKQIYNPFYQQLANLPLIVENARIKVYATGSISSAKFYDVDSFLQAPPIGSIIATDDKGLKINQEIRQGDSAGISSGEFINREDSLVPSFIGVDTNESFETTTSIRGPQRLYFFSNGGNLEATITKRDLNWYEGADTLQISIYSLDGILKNTTEIPDDGDKTTSRKLGPSQYQTLKVDDLELGVYRLELASVDGGTDFLITYLAFNQSKLVMLGKLFLAGDFYLTGEPNSMTIWCYLFSEGEIKLSTPHSLAQQNVAISGDSYSEIINLDSVNTKYSTGSLKEGIYKITSGKGDVTIEAPSGYFAFTEDSLFLPTSSFNHEENGSLVINTSLRGGHTFWTYVQDNSLELKITKQDLNWYEGADELKIEVSTLDGGIKGNVSILDDGEQGDGKKPGPLQSGLLKLDDLHPGVYMIDLKGSGDLLIRQVEINQLKLVVDKNMFLVGANPAYSQGGMAFDPVRLYTRTFKMDHIKFKTYHNSGMQQIILQGNGHDIRVDVNELNSEVDVDLKAGTYQLTVPKQNVVIESNYYFSFTPDSFFLPQRVKTVDLTYDLEWLRENADYIVLNSENYTIPMEDNGWLIAQADWKRQDLLISDNKLNFCLSVPHLDRQQDKIIPIDWISVTLKVPPIWERVSWLRQVIDRIGSVF